MRGGALLFAIWVALALAACGGGDAQQEGSTTATAVVPDGEATPTTTAGPAEGASAGRHKDGAGRPKPESGNDRSDAAGPEPGTKAVANGVPVQDGGDNSVQMFGVEGAVDERAQALSTLRAYLRAGAVADWSKACTETSEEFKEQLATLVRIGKGKKKLHGCTTTLRLLLGRSPRSMMRRAAEVRELLSFRVEGDYAYVIFKSADGKVRFIAMADDNGEWKVNTTQPGELLPSG